MTEPDDDVLDAGREAPRVLGLLGHRAVLAVVAAVVLVAAVITLAGQHAGRHRAAPSRSATAAPTPLPSASPSVDLEYLLAVPAQDLLDALGTAQCRGGCQTHRLVDAELDRASLGFTRLVPVAGGSVLRKGMVVLRSVEGTSGDEVIVHLTTERVHDPDAGLRVTDSSRGGQGIVVLALIRRHWRLTATLAGPGVEPVKAAAVAWLRRAPLPG